ncbi:MAG TPA: ATP-binding domain-containing protein, partial [Jiangellaceae bacterium]|nr:ATP-binding domain-containing protein [Jiangellaceae bacterium]
VRSTGTRPWAVRVDDLAAGLTPVVADALESMGAGRLAVIVPPAAAPEFDPDTTRQQLAAAGLPAARGNDPAALDSPVVVLTTAEAKGLEFDSVIVSEPAAIVSGTQHGWRDLYVAVTRSTAHLGVVHTGELPVPLGSLPPPGVV